MRYIYSYTVWEPDAFANDWVVTYHCGTIRRMPNESVWIVPGTLDLLEVQMTDIVLFIVMFAPPVAFALIALTNMEN